jgi:subtilisin family serine protease
MKKNIFFSLILAASMLLSMAQFTPAEAIQPQSGHVPPAPDSLNEVVEYYGRLGDIQGQIGVVVEFSSKPAAVVYAEAKERLLAPAALPAVTKSQVSLIQEEQNTFASALRSSGIDVRELYRTQRAYNGIALYIDAENVAELAKMPGVKAIHPLIPKEIDHTTSVPLIGALQVWAGSSEYQGQNIRVGVIDTGIDYIHTNFGGPGDYTGQDFTTLGEPGNLFPTAKVVGGWDFAGDDYNADPNSATYDPIPQPDPDPMDCNGHGSHVSGTTAGLGVLPDGSTYVEGAGDTYADLAALSANDYMAKFRIGPGVAPKADLYALRVFGCAGSTDLTDVAIEWAMDPNGDSDLSDHLDVINMSLGSSFGSQYDPSAVASNNAALAGVLVVASAGNSGDVFYITGAPGVAQRVISVASSQDSSAVLSAFDVTASSNASLVDSYMAGTASFGPQSFDVTGDAVVAAPYQACTAITNDVTGKIAVVQRGTCNFSLKVENAQAAGAIGVLIVNNAAGFPPALGGTSTATIPVMSARDVDGNAIVAELNASGTATIKLDSSLNYLIVDPTLEDKVSTFTSRGVARGGSYLKPDVTAPGDTIYSTANGTGDKGVSFNGTSMAAPHVAGVMALLRQQHPGWSVEDLKALVMNTATNDVYNAAGTLPNTPSRVGAGRVSVLNATESEVVAYNTTNPELVSLPFGEVKVVDDTSGVDQTFTKTVTVKNTGAAAETYDVAFILRYTANPGITFSLLDSSDNPLSSLTVPASGTETIKVKVDLDAALLEKTLDPTLGLGARSRMSESGGLVQLTSTGSAPTLRVPVHIAARAASSMDVAETSLTLSAAASGTVSLTSSGTPIDLASDYSIASIFELLGESPAIPGLPVPTLASADLQYIGAMSNYPAEAWADSTVFFGVSTFAQWDTLYSTEFDIYIDINEDDVEDYVVYNYDTGAGTTTRTDAFATVVVNLNTSSGGLSNYVNYFGGSTNTNIFNNNVAVLPVDVAQIGLNETTNTDFNFYIVTYHRESETYVDVSDVYHYDVSKKAFDSTNAAFLNTPLWDDNPAYSPTFDIAYDKANMNANTQGLLILHHHNAVNTAEVIPLDNNPAFGKTAPADNATAVSLSPMLSWNPSDGATSYEYCYSSSAGPCTQWHSVGTNTSVTINDLAADYTYYWQVRAVHGDGAIEADDGTWWSFTTTAVSACTWPPYTAPATPTFGDVPMDAGHWSWVERLSNATITAGCGGGNYCPFSEVVRAQMAIFLLRGKHCGNAYVPPAVGASTGFGDVPLDATYAPWVKQLAAEGITAGCGGGNFCPLQVVNRAQMAIFLLRAKHGATYSPPAVGATTGFGDVPLDATYAPWVKQLAAEGITAGCGGGNFCPLQNVNRAQMSIFLVRAFDLP